MSQRILVVDDEPAVTDLLAYNLRKAHYDLPAKRYAVSIPANARYNLGS